MSIKQEAQDRHDLHEGQDSHRPLSENYELVGLKGEAEFARMFMMERDRDLRPGGDMGIDFHIHLDTDTEIRRFSVDVKTARKTGNLIIEQKQKHDADIYVLAKYDDDTESATLLGWEWGKTLRQAPVKDFGHGVINHYIPRRNLRPISELKKRFVFECDV